MRGPILVVIVDDDTPPLSTDDVLRTLDGVPFTYIAPGSFEICGGAEGGGATLARDDRQRWLWISLRRGRLVSTPVSTTDTLELRLGWVRRRTALAA